VLVDTRERLRRSERPDRIFEAVLEIAKGAGLVGRKRVLDSTALYDAVATQDTVTLIRSAIRGLLRVVDAALEVELRAALRREDDYRSAGKPACDWDDETAREAMVEALARDGYAALTVLDGRELAADVKQAAELLATVLGQDLELAEDGRFRIARRVAPDRVISTVDPEARHGHKTAARGFDGYKGHVSVDPDSEIIVGTAVTAGNVGDAQPAVALLDEVLSNEEKIDESVEIYGDSSYGTADLVEHIESAGAEAHVKVQPPSAKRGMFSQDAFVIDSDAHTVRCPAGVRPVPTEWGSLDTRQAPGETDAFIYDQVFDTLLKYDPDGEIRGNIAKSWTVSQDGGAIELVIEPSAHFHDGSRLRPSDVVYSIERIIKSASYPASGLSTIKRVVADDAGNRVRIELKTPNPRFLITLMDSLFSIVKRGESSEKLNGTGPFQLDRKDPNRIVLRRNARYHGKVAEIGALEIRVMSKAGAKAAFLRGEVDDLFHHHLGADDRKELGSACQWVFELLPTFRFIVLKAGAHPALAEREDRECIISFIDRGRLVSSLGARSPEARRLPSKGCSGRGSCAFLPRGGPLRARAAGKDSSVD